jgi:hypothetical protein
MTLTNHSERKCKLCPDKGEDAHIALFDVRPEVIYFHDMGLNMEMTTKQSKMDIIWKQEHVGCLGHPAANTVR